MSWREIRDQWEADPTFRQEFDEEHPYASVALAVAKLRADKDMTQAQLADAVGTTQSVIARLESGRHAVSVAMLGRIAGALAMEWFPVFRPVGGGGLAERPAVNDAAANVTVIAHYFIDANTYSFRWPGKRFTEPQGNLVFVDYLDVTDEDTVFVPIQGFGAGWTGVFSNEPLRGQPAPGSVLPSH